ncbi:MULTISPECIES: hypothetical protein [Bacillales]|uniref:hypothetical protein n=1 Tax=Bacillales TaxID=1385 RepID=UPI00034619E9|nr:MULTISPECIES: hypothetical protein [Bacillales]KMZ40594.1 hypothetical protein AC624_05605 [Bacillus sp. FJAT-27238]
MRWKWVLIFVITWLSFSIRPAMAESNVDIQFEIPLSGIVKYESWMRLNVKVTSQEKDFTGSVELSQRQVKKNNEWKLRRPIKLEQGKSTTVYFDMPTQILLDDWYVQVTQNGQVVKSEKLRISYPTDGRTIGVISEEGNAFHFLAVNQSQSKMNRPLSVQNLTEQMLPDQSWIYENIDMLALAGNSGSTINDQQMAAIKEWIQLGGIVVVSAGPNQDGMIQRFADILPVEAGKAGNIDLQQALSEYDIAKVAPKGSIGVYNRDLPLFVSKPYGRGLLLFVNYDVTAEPLASWQFNPQLWQNAMTQHGAKKIFEEKLYMDQMTRPFLDLSKKIPEVQTPPPTWMVALWGGYVIVLAPLTYFILRRMRKPEWAWGVIPLGGIFLTVAIFAIGKPAVVKTSTSYAVTKIDILDESLAHVRSAATFLGVDQNDYDVQLEPSIVALPLTVGRNDYRPEGLMNGEELLSFRNLPYLTPKQAIGIGVKHDMGAFDASLRINENRVQGHVKNNTEFAYDQTYIEIGFQRIPLGPLKKGEEKQIDSVLEPLFMPRKPQASNELQTLEERIKEMRERVVEYEEGNQVSIIGTTTEPLPLMTMQVPHQAHYWNVIQQPIQFQPNEQGIVTFPYGLLDAEMYETTGDFDNTGYIWQIGKGSITFELRADKAAINMKRITVPLNHSSFKPFRIEYFHQKSGRWIPVERGTRLVLDKELQQVLTPNQSLLLRFSHNGTSRLALPEPIFQVEGVRKW